MIQKIKLTSNPRRSQRFSIMASHQTKLPLSMTIGCKNIVSNHQAPEKNSKNLHSRSKSVHIAKTKIKFCKMIKKIDPNIKVEEDPELMFLNLESTTLSIGMGNLTMRASFRMKINESKSFLF